MDPLGVAGVSVTVRLADGTEDTNPAAVDFTVDDGGMLALLNDKPDTPGVEEIALYAPGWVRVRIDAAPAK